MLKHLAVCGSILLGLLALPSPQALSQETKTGGAIQVRVNYTGSGTVDASHNIYVVLWDSAKFIEEGSNLMPIDVKPVDSKKGTAVFDKVSANPAYVSVAYDPTGQWTAMSPPPSGSSLGLYTKSGGKPEPVTTTAEKPTTIDLPFDDSFKVP